MTYQVTYMDQFKGRFEMPADFHINDILPKCVDMGWIPAEDARELTTMMSTEIDFYFTKFGTDEVVGRATQVRSYPLR